LPNVIPWGFARQNLPPKHPEDVKTGSNGCSEEVIIRLWSAGASCEKVADVLFV